MKVFVRSIATIQNINPENDYIVISVQSPDAKYNAIVPVNKYCKGILRTRFYDIDKPLCYHGDMLYPMTIEQSNEIARFVKENADVQEVYVHCEAGISRSAGLARAIAEYYAIPFSLQGYCPNLHCYRTLLSSFR